MIIETCHFAIFRHLDPCHLLTLELHASTIVDMVATMRAKSKGFRSKSCCVDSALTYSHLVNAKMHSIQQTKPLETSFCRSIRNNAGQWVIQGEALPWPKPRRQLISTTQPPHLSSPVPNSHPHSPAIVLLPRPWRTQGRAECRVDRSNSMAALQAKR